MNVAAATTFPGLRRGAPWSGGADGVAGLNAALMRSRPISVHRNILEMVGSASAGILLSQLIYWTRHGSEVVQRDGWVFKTADQWKHETGMTWKVQRRARRRLCALGLVEERRVSLPCRLEFRLNLNVLASKTGEHIRVQVQDLSLDMFRSENGFIREMLGPVLSYHRVLARLVPHVNDALLLSRCLFSMRRTDGTLRSPSWLMLSRDEWNKETALSRDEWETARRHLRLAGLLIEKHTNFPRRVDVMVHCGNLTEQLQALRVEKLSTAPSNRETRVSPCSDSVRRDWAIQDTGKTATGKPTPIGGNGRNRELDFRAPVSPIPAFKSRPILPSRIARSPLYRRELLQEELLQQPLHLAPAHAVPIGQSTQGGGGSSISPNPPLARPTVEVRSTGEELQPRSAGEQPEVIHWPKRLDEGDREAVVRHAAGLPDGVLQLLLDEMSWQNSVGTSVFTVRNPLAYLRKLRRSYEEGVFVAEGAHKIAADRRRIAAHALVEQRRAMAAPSATAAEVPPAPGPSRAESVARLQQVRASIASRAGGVR